MPKNIAIVCSEFNKDLTDKMLSNAIRTAKNLKLNIVKIIKVPGVLEIPFAVKKLLMEENIDAIATLGAVLKGKTDHDKLVAYTAALKITELSLQYEKPVSIGIIGPNTTKKVAEERIIEYSTRAIKTIEKMLKI